MPSIEFTEQDAVTEVDVSNDYLPLVVVGGEQSELRKVTPEVLHSAVTGGIKRYVALVSLNDGELEDLQVLENSLGGDIAFERQFDGIYDFILPQAFPANKIVARFGSLGTGQHHVRVFPDADGLIRMVVSPFSDANAPTDNAAIYGVPLEITVYP